MEENTAGTEPDQHTAPIARVRRIRPRVVDDQADPPGFWEDVARQDDDAEPRHWDRAVGDQVDDFEALLVADDGTRAPRRIVWWAAAVGSVAALAAFLACLVPVVRLVWLELWP